MGRCMDCIKTFPWLRVLRVVGTACGLTIIALGLYELIAETPDIKGVIDNIYRIIFGILIVIAELQWVHMLDWFSFLTSLIGLGGFYIFVGGLALGGEWYAITIAVVMVFVGLVYCISACGCKDDRPGVDSLKARHANEWRDPDHTGRTPPPPREMQNAPPQQQQAASSSWPHMGEDAL